MMDAAQAAPFIHSMTYEASLLDYADFPRTEHPVNILGTTYSALHELEDIKHDIKSRLWFTYRWGFTPIAGDGPTSDQGWGCMLRCGQMMLAQALVNLHLGREWRWNEGKNDPNYYKILKMFLDKKTCTYSIHQIANMGASEGKAIGEWFGPNTIAQVLKKLAMYDDWSQLNVHVALDNTVIIEDIKSICKCTCRDCDTVPENLTLTLGEGGGSTSNNNKTTATINSTENISSSNYSTPKVTNSDNSHVKSSANSHAHTSQQSGRPTIFERIQSENIAGIGARSKHSTDINADSPSVFSSNEGNDESCTCSSGYGSTSVAGRVIHGSNHVFNGEDSGAIRTDHWKPVLVIIPLRLGLTEINPVYINALKNCLALRQSVGIIGGKPNQAHWFVGVVGEELIFLDPHTRQPVEDMINFSDESYHCPYACRMSITELDPSIALGFLCRTEADFNDFCLSIQKFIICTEKTPMFEMHGKRPKHWPAFNPGASYNDASASSSEYEFAERQYDTDEEFELI